MLGLYLHIPFCHHICPYCDFCKMVASRTYIQKYILALEKEIEIKKISMFHFDTLYIGGGTPSSLDDDLFESVLSLLSKSISLSNLQEFTIEFNPEDITDSKIELLKKYYVSRVSIGVQSFLPQVKKTLNRHSDYEDIKLKLNKLHLAKIKNISVDLMYSVFPEKQKDLEQDLDLFTRLPITHISTYSLILEDHTIFSHLYQKNKFELTDEKEEANCYSFLTDYLENKGFHNYETSNFAIEGYESRHNLIYWNDEEYIALGAGASSYYHHIREKTTSQIGHYCDELLEHQHVVCDEHVELTKIDEMEEFVLLGLRKSIGISIQQFNDRFQENIEIIYPKINDLIHKGYLQKQFDHLFIPKRYRYVQNTILVMIFDTGE